jgi:hypothetical protein
MRAPAGAPTNPAAGVIATRLPCQYRTLFVMATTHPAIAPVQKPTMLHFRSRRKSMMSQVMPLMGQWCL